MRWIALAIIVIALALPLSALAQGTPTPLSAPTALPLPTPLPTLLPDQTLAVLPAQGQAITDLGTQPTGWAIVALLILWLLLRMLLRVQGR